MIIIAVLFKDKEKNDYNVLDDDYDREKMWW